MFKRNPLGRLLVISICQKVENSDVSIMGEARLLISKPDVFICKPKILISNAFK